MIKNNTNIEKSILKTLAYYRALKTPLTLVQVGRYLVAEKDGVTDSLSAIELVLNDLIKQRMVTKQKGLYWLNSCAKSSSKINTAPRIKTWLSYIRLEKTAQSKINKVRKALKFFAAVPFLRAVFICGSVERKVSHPDSDIDFLILAKQNRVWIVRFCLTALAFLLGKKTNDRVSRYTRKDKFCLNHYRSSSKLKLEEELRDLYSAQEYARMINLYSRNRIDRKFFKKNKKWFREILPNFNSTKLPLYRVEEYGVATFLQKKMENVLRGKIGNIIEKLFYRVQIQKIKLSGKKFLSSPRRIIMDEEVIMFHLTPRAPLILNRYKQITDNL